MWFAGSAAGVFMLRPTKLLVDTVCCRSAYLRLLVGARQRRHPSQRLKTFELSVETGQGQ